MGSRDSAADFSFSLRLKASPQRVRDSRKAKTRSQSSRDYWSTVLTHNVNPSQIILPSTSSLPLPSSTSQAACRHLHWTPVQVLHDHQQNLQLHRGDVSKAPQRYVYLPSFNQEMYANHSSLCKQTRPPSPTTATGAIFEGIHRDLKRKARRAGSQLSKRRFHCQICPRSFERRGHLEEHVDAIHDSIKQHVCSQCDRDFSHRSSLRRHLLRLHNASFPKPKSGFRTIAKPPSVIEFQRATVVRGIN
jgi:hypothetical protein